MIKTRLNGNVTFKMIKYGEQNMSKEDESSKSELSDEALNQDLN